MKRIIFVFAIVIVFIAIAFGILETVDNYYGNKIKNVYFDSIGDIEIPEKDQGIALQEESLSRSDNIQLHGSSELATKDIYTHPSNIFMEKASGFQINLVGRGYSQSLIHAINMGALGDNLQNKKVVFILSPQWFSTEGITSEQFEINFSELQFYSLMFSKDLDKNLKVKVAARTAQLLKNNPSFEGTYEYARLFSSQDAISKIGTAVVTPYVRLKFYLLSIKDKVQSYKEIKGLNNNVSTKSMKSDYDWGNELITAEKVAKEKTSNNEFNIENNYYDKYIKDRLASLKGVNKGGSYVNSPEYEDLTLLLDICKEKGISPMFVSVPVQGQWYDYCGFQKEEMQKYYNKVSNLIKAYNFQVLDLSSHEYDKYFLKDVMHLGWKGWIYIDKAIDEYYHSN